MAYQIAHELVKEAVTHNRRHDKVVFSVHIFLHCAAMSEIYLNMSEEKRETRRITEQSTERKRQLADVRDSFQLWVQNRSQWGNFHDTLQVKHILLF